MSKGQDNLTDRSRRPVVAILWSLVLAAFVAVFAFAALGEDAIPRPATRPLAVAPQPTARPLGADMMPGVSIPGLMAGSVRPATAPATRPATMPIVASRMEKELIRRGDKSDVPATQAATSNGKTAAPGYDVGRVLLSLVAVIGLILVLKWGSKKVFTMPSAGRSSVMQVVSRTPLAPKQQILLLRVGRRLIVIGDSGGRLTSLGQIADPDEVASLLSQSQAASETPATSITFGSLLKRMGPGRGRPADEAGWSELEEQSIVTPGNERAGLLDRVTGAGDSDRIADVLDEELDDATPPDADPAEQQAKAAVEAARTDIEALRAKLREVTGRLAGPQEPGTSVR